MQAVVSSEAKERLEWLDGVGFLGIDKPIEYGYQHFLDCCEEEKKALFRDLTRHHINMVRKAVSFRKRKTICLDIGIGGGHFIREMNRITDIETKGLDLNEYSIKWMNDNDYLSNRDVYDILTFWGTFDKLSEPLRYVKEYKPKFVAMSLPIFEYKEQVLSSPLLKIGERQWFFTKLGLIGEMSRQNFSLLSTSGDDGHKYGLHRYQSFVFASNTIVS